LNGGVALEVDCLLNKTLHYEGREGTTEVKTKYSHVLPHWKGGEKNKLILGRYPATTS